MIGRQPSYDNIARLAAGIDFGTGQDLPTDLNLPYIDRYGTSDRHLVVELLQLEDIYPKMLLRGRHLAYNEFC